MSRASKPCLNAQDPDPSLSAGDLTARELERPAVSPVPEYPVTDFLVIEVQPTEQPPPPPPEQPPEQPPPQPPTPPEQPPQPPPVPEYPVTDFLVIEVQPTEQPPEQQPSPLEQLLALLPHLISVVLLIALILYIGNAVLEAVKGRHGG